MKENCNTPPFNPLQTFGKYCLTVNMSTTASIPTLSLSEFAHLVSKQYYHFLSQSLHNLEHRVEWHQAEQHAMELNIMNF